MKGECEIQWFGILGDRRGVASERVEMDVATVGDLYDRLALEHGLGIGRGAVRAVVDDEFVAWNFALKDGASVAFLPPMSGG